MSLALPKLAISKSYDPRLKLTSQRNYNILMGGVENSFKPVVSTSYSTTQASWTAPPPNPAVVVDRHIYMQLYLDIVSNTGPFQLGTTDGPACYPVARCTNTISIKINNSSVTLQTSDVFPWILRDHTEHEQEFMDYSSSPSFPDQYQNLGDWTTYGSARNPLAQYGENSYANSRGGFPLEIISANRVKAVFTEPIFLSPLLFGHDQHESGFVGVQSFDVNVNFNNLYMCWSHDSINGQVIGVNDLIVTHAAAPQILFNYITPNSISTPIPSEIVYPYFDIQRYVTNGPTVNSGAFTTLQSSNIQLQSIPRKVYIFARETNNNRDFTSSDVFGSCYVPGSGLAGSVLTMNFNNKNAIFSSATAQDLYQMSVRNGLKMSWPQFSKFVGSCIVIDFGVDVPLGLDEAPGKLGTYQLQFNYKWYNSNTVRNIQYDMYCIVINEGIMTILNNSSVLQIGVIAGTDIIEVSKNPATAVVPYSRANSVYGGNIFSDIGKFFKETVYEKGLKPAYEAVAPIAKDVLLPSIGKRVTDKLGLGMSAKRMYRKKMRGGELVNRSELQSALMDM